jgi:hypothetical protein
MAKLAKSLKLITLCQFLSKTEEYINQEEMVGALMKSQKEEDQAKESSNKVAPTTSTKKEEKNSKKPNRKAGPQWSKTEPRR